MAIRVEGEYFSIFSVSDVQGNRPTQSGKLFVNFDMLEALCKVAKAQEEAGEEVKVPIDMGFWVQTAKDSGRKYMRGKPSVYLDDVSDSASTLLKKAEEEAPNDIPF
tara:strand:- start:127 stop:447 length:321 start_codon:yes stop_codon:yes gene_type:complete